MQLHCCPCVHFAFSRRCARLLEFRTDYVTRNVRKFAQVSPSRGPVDPTERGERSCVYARKVCLRLCVHGAVLQALFARDVSLSKRQMCALMPPHAAASSLSTAQPVRCTPNVDSARNALSLGCQVSPPLSNVAGVMLVRPSLPPPVCDLDPNAFARAPNAECIRGTIAESMDTSEIQSHKVAL